MSRFEQDEPLSIEISQVPCQIHLEDKCWSCDGGTREPRLKNDDGKCDICGGRGLKLTEAGEVFAEFLRRYVRLGV